MSIKKFTKLRRQVKLGVGIFYFIEEGIEDKKILFKCPLNSIAYIKIRHRKDFHVIKICDLNHFAYKVKLTSYEADYLLASIYHSIQSKENQAKDNQGKDSQIKDNQTNDNEYNIPILLIEPMDLGIKVKGIPNDIDSAFDNSIKKEIEEAIGRGDVLDPKLRWLLMDAGINMNFKNQGYDSGFIASMFHLLNEYSKIINKLEKEENGYEKYETYKEEKADGDNTGKVMAETYQTVTLVLNIIRNSLFLRTSAPDTTTFLNQINTLFYFSTSKNSAISFMSSITLRTLLRVLLVL